MMRGAWERIGRKCRGVALAVVVGLFAAAVLAEPAAGQAAGTISGELRDGRTGQPVSGARVSVEGSRAAVLSNVQGGFTLRSGSGAQVVVVERVGYVTAREPVDVAAGATVRVRIELAEQPVALDQVVVSATRAEARLEDVPGSVSVVSRGDLDNRNLRRLDNALGMVPGVFNERPTPVDDTHGTVVIRGVPGQRRTLIMVDGVPLNDAYNGNVRFNGLPVEQVERLEVVRGPASSLYGGYAMGGAINVVTRMPAGRRVNVATGYGNALGSDFGLKDQRKVFVSVEERPAARLGVMASVEYQDMDGYAWDPIVKAASTGAGTLPGTGAVGTTDRTGAPRYVIGHTGDRNVTDYNVGLRAVYDLAATSSMRFSFFKAHHRYEHTGATSYLRDPLGNPIFEGNVVHLDGVEPRRLVVRESDFAQGNGEKDQYFYSAALHTELAGSDLRWSVGYNDLRPRYTSLNAAATRTDGPGKTVSGPSASLNSDLQLSRPLLGRHVLTVGASLKRDEASLAEHDLSRWTDLSTRGGLIYEARGGTDTYALFAQNEILLLDNLTAHLGLRFDRWTTSDGYADDVGKPGYPEEYESRTSSFVSPRAALLYRPWEATAVRASVGRAFRGPTVFELYRTWTLSTGRVNRSNPNLEPETSTSWDAGIQQTVWSGARVGATYFHNDIRNMIHRKVIDPMLAEFENTGRVITRGVELEAQQRLTGWANLFANSTYTDAIVRENETNPVAEGKQVPFIPQRQWNAGAELFRGPATAAVHARHVGRRFSTDDNSDHVSGVPGSRDAVTLLDLKVAADVGRRLRASLSVDNVLDREYFDFNRAPGRSFFVELSTAF